MTSCYQKLFSMNFKNRLVLKPLKIEHYCYISPKMSLPTIISKENLLFISNSLQQYWLTQHTKTITKIQWKSLQTNSLHTDWPSQCALIGDCNRMDAYLYECVYSCMGIRMTQFSDALVINKRVLYKCMQVALLTPTRIPQTHAHADTCT